MNPRSPLPPVAVVLVAVAVVIAWSFASVGFAVAEHRTNTGHQIGTSSTNGAAMTVPDDLVLYVVGPDPFRGQVEDALVDALSERGMVARVVSELDPDYDSPVLLVGAGEPRFAYNPLTPSADVDLTFEYAASGNVSQFGHTDDEGPFDDGRVDDYLLNGRAVPITLDDENRFFRGGEVHVTDATTGVSSWPGYRAHVVDALVETTVTGLLADAV